jgi:hypothetical protein
MDRHIERSEMTHARADGSVLGQLSRLALQLTTTEQLRHSIALSSDETTRRVDSLELAVQCMKFACGQLEMEVLNELREAGSCERRATRAACDALALAMTGAGLDHS